MENSIARRRKHLKLSQAEVAQLAELRGQQLTPSKIYK